MNTPENTKLQTVAKTGGNFRWLSVTALLLAIGAILHLVSPNIGGVTPNWMIAMYCIAINLTRPGLGKAAGIGLVAGALLVPTSKSAFPYGNFPSELVGALVCAIIVNMGLKFAVGGFSLRPGLCAFLSTVASGMVFITILKVVLVIPMSVYLYGMVPVVFTVAAVNAVITQVLYFPAAKLFGAAEGK